MEAPGGLWGCAGGAVLNERPLNLLRYPRRQQLLDPVLLRPVMGGLLAGGLLAAAGAAWQGQKQARLQAQRAPLLAQLQVQAQQESEARKAAAQRQLSDRMNTRAQAWLAQRRQLMQWHAFWGEEAEAHGLRMQRWQGDGRKVTLQLWLPRPDLVPGLVARLSEISPDPWTLHSLSVTRGTDGVQAVIESPWPRPAASTPQERKP